MLRCAILQELLGPADVYLGLVGISRLKRAVQPRGERNAIVHAITCGSDPNCGMLSFHPYGERSGPITSAGSFYLRTGLVGSKA